MPCPVSYQTRLGMLSGRMRQARPTANVSVLAPADTCCRCVYSAQKHVDCVLEESGAFNVLDASQSHVTSISGLRLLRRGVSRVGRRASFKLRALEAQTPTTPTLHHILTHLHFASSYTRSHWIAHTAELRGEQSQTCSSKSQRRASLLHFNILLLSPDYSVRVRASYFLPTRSDHHV